LVADLGRGFVLYAHPMVIDHSDHSGAEQFVEAGHRKRAIADREGDPLR
jgi:hypothetical protein